MSGNKIGLHYVIFTKFVPILSSSDTVLLCGQSTKSWSRVPGIERSTSDNTNYVIAHSVNIISGNLFWKGRKNIPLQNLRPSVVTIFQGFPWIVEWSFLKRFKLFTTQNDRRVFLSTTHQVMCGDVICKGWIAIKRMHDCKILQIIRILSELISPNYRVFYTNVNNIEEEWN